MDGIDAAIGIVGVLLIVWFAYTRRSQDDTPPYAPPPPLRAHTSNYEFTPNYWIGGDRISRNIGTVEQGARDCDADTNCAGFDWDGEAAALRRTVPATLWPNTRTDLAPHPALGAYVKRSR